MIGSALQRIAAEYPAARGESFSGHPLANFIRDDAKDLLREALPEQGRGLIVKGSAGNGNFATVPWLAVFDPLVTTSATKGYYVVLLYSFDGALFLSVNQGATAVRREFGAIAREVLIDRAKLIRARLPEYSEFLPLTAIDLKSSQLLPRDYEAGHAMGVKYGPDKWPSEERIFSDLASAIKAYRSLTFRGGVEPSPEAVAEEELGRPLASLTEVRQYKLHRRIERNPRAAAIVKLLRGYTCDACGFNFAHTYGELGKNYIEAHHLRPLGQLDEGVIVEFDAEDDFAVLCGNCHRMIHRMDDSSGVAALRQAIKSASEEEG